MVNVDDSIHSIYLFLNKHSFCLSAIHKMNGSHCCLMQHFVKD